MTTTLDITPTQRELLLTLLQQYLPDTTAWAYGSRVKGTARPHSDLDLAVFAAPEQKPEVSRLREALQESNLPFRVDLFIWDEIPESFQKTIREEHVVLLKEEQRVKMRKNKRGELS